MAEQLKTSSKKALSYNYFPKKYLAVIWRNWETVPVSNIAKALHTSVKNIVAVAKKMGLNEPKNDKTFLKRGYLTVIRNNWHLLSYKQICTLLEIKQKELAFILKEDDFMWHKMGELKPDTGNTVYEPLNKAEEEQLTEYSKILKNQLDLKKEYCENGFEFLKRYEKYEIKPEKRGDQNGYDVVLPDDLKFVYQKDETVDMYVKDFCTELNKRWNMSVENNEEGNYLIEIDLNLKDKKSGSYIIDIKKQSIHISGTDDKGVYTALSNLNRKMKENKGPYLNEERIEKNTVFDIRYIYSYFALYGDALLDESLDPYPEGLLKQLADSGVNGIWMQGILYQLTKFPFDLKLSSGYKKRRKSLNSLIKKAKRFGIDIYLYFNEPRAMDEALYEKYPDLKGEREGDFYAMCTSKKEVKDYLYNGMKDLFENVPVAGFFTITMSENLTNCYSRLGNRDMTCERCKERKPYEVVAEVNNLMARGAKAGRSDAKAIAWTWGWDEKWSKKAINALDKDIALMCVNEEGMELNVAGYNPRVIDYTMTVPGPSIRSKTNWNTAKQDRRKTLSKVQLNCTWELAAVPFIPLADICSRRIQNIAAEGVEGLMLSWTLGGCSSQNLDIASLYYYRPVEDNCLDKYLKRRFGKKAYKAAKKAQTEFSNAITEFPFSLPVLYTAPQNYAPAALFYEYKTDYKATMIGFPYDDINTWKSIYSKKDFHNQFNKLVLKWKQGIDILEGIKCDTNENFKELLNISKAVYCHFKSTVNHIGFVIQRDKLLNKESDEKQDKVKKDIIEILKSEIQVVRNIIAIRGKDSRVGYEASNHYFYTMQDLKEKIINLDYLIKKFTK